jgi:Zn-dependent protease with chaperone function
MDCFVEGPHQKIAAKFYPNGSSQCLDVEIDFNDERQLRVKDAESYVLFSGKLAQLKVSDPLGSLPRELAIPDVGLLIVNPEPDFNRWLSSGSTVEKLASLEKAPSFIFLACIMVPLVLYVVFKYAIPSAAVHFANWVPDSAVRVASQHTLYVLDNTVLSDSELADNKQIELHSAWMSAIDKLELDEQQFSVQFRKGGGLGANAFALPDGTIVFTDELIELLKYDEKLSTAILLHEIGHVQEKHSMRLISETLATSIAIDYFFGDLGAVIEAFGGVANTLLTNQFSQKLEWEADIYALTHASKVGLNNDSFADAMQILSDTLPSSSDSETESYLSSHPIMQKRIDNARTFDIKSDQ